MVTGDMPTILDAGHAHSTYGLGNLMAPLSTTAATTDTIRFLGAAGDGGLAGLARGQIFTPARQIILAAQQNQRQQPAPKQENPVMTRRLVQVFIADPDDNVPLEQSMLYTGEQKLTDATDQELFFEIDMKTILDKHNADRVKLINKKVKERVENLEPVKIRDLRMVVVNVATF
jgi:hypothetical protein